MPHDVFISYVSRDQAAADATCAALEDHGIRCWIAPRDVLAGTDFGTSIVSAIKMCSAVVLILSTDANNSPHVLREVERAVRYGKCVVSVRIDDVFPSRGLEYYLEGRRCSLSKQRK